MENLMTELGSLGAAGLMGAMWLWERKLSRQRDQQIGEAHERIMRDEQRLSKLTEVVAHNTSAITRFAEMQRTQNEILSQLLKGGADHADA
jgi:hypothetical protein